MKFESSNPILAQLPMLLFTLAVAISLSLLLASPELSQAQKHDADAEVTKLWPNGIPDEDRTVGAERDFTKATDTLIGGRRIIKLGNVSAPEIHLYRPEAILNTGTAVVICPGGGFNILAWDLEGTEVAKWFKSIGVTAAVVKYRVPTHRLKVPWQGPVQDTQRAISLLRSRSDELGLDPKRIGALGFSAGAVAAARTGLMQKRTYRSSDLIDKSPCKPDFMMLIYAGGLSNADGTRLNAGLVVDKETPPTFLVHAFDDYVPLDNPMVLMRALKNSNVPSELHVYDAGGHGYGMRRVDELPVTSWSDRLNEWMSRRGLLDVPTVEK